MGEKGLKRTKYTEEEIESGLHEMALCSGSPTMASERLARMGVQITKETLSSWKHNVHRDRYQRVVEEVLPKVYARVAQRNERMAEKLMDAEDLAIDQFTATHKEMRAAEASTAARNFAVAKGVSLDKAALIRGRPTEIREDRNMGQLLRALTARFPSAVQVEAEVSATESESNEPPDELGPSPPRSEAK